MRAGVPQRTTVIMAGLVSVLVFAAYSMGRSEQNAGPSRSVMQTAAAAETGPANTPQDLAARRDNYFPNTEPIGQMRCA